jgi:DNA-binding NarL/FixJ family response regulator
VRIRAQAAGARAFITKTARPDTIAETIDAVLKGDVVFRAGEGARDLPVLTARQFEVLTLLAAGHGNKEIRHRLNIAERTVRAHLTELFQLLGAHSRMQAVIRARELGLIP